MPKVQVKCVRVCVRARVCVRICTCLIAHVSMSACIAQLKPYLPMDLAVPKTYPIVSHDILAVMEAEGYMPTENATQKKASPPGEVGFPSERSMKKQISEAREDMPDELHDELVQYGQDWRMKKTVHNEEKTFKRTRRIFWLPKRLRRFQ